MVNKLLISGEMRSGTTMIANFLNCQKNITVYRDFLHIERLAKAIGMFSLSTPLSIKQKTQLIYRFNYIDSATLGIIVPINPEDFSNIGEFYNAVLKYVGDKNDQCVGHKSTRVYQIVPELLRYNEELKVIYMIRDPRDVIISASKKFAGENVYDHIKKWKKGVDLLDGLMKNYQERIHLIRFEDLLVNTESELGRLAKFLHIHELAIPKNLCDYGENWIDNSSYGDLKQLFDPRAVNRWKDKPFRINKPIEILCKTEMKRYHYECCNKIRGRHPILVISVMTKYYLYHFLNDFPYRIKRVIKICYHRFYRPLIKLLLAS